MKGKQLFACLFYCAACKVRSVYLVRRGGTASEGKKVIVGRRGTRFFVLPFLGKTKATNKRGGKIIAVGLGKRLQQEEGSVDFSFCMLRFAENSNRFKGKTQ